MTDAKIKVTADDVKLLQHTLHRATAMGGGPMYLEALERFVQRVERAVAKSSHEPEGR